MVSDSITSKIACMHIVQAHLLSLAAEFRSYFERYGKVVSSEVLFNRETHKSRGFGFVVFEHEQSAVKVCAAAAAQEHSIDGKVVSPIYTNTYIQPYKHTQL